MADYIVICGNNEGHGSCDVSRKTKIQLFNNLLTSHDSAQSSTIYNKDMSTTAGMTRASTPLLYSNVSSVRIYLLGFFIFGIKQQCLQFNVITGAYLNKRYG